nr:hypothetical protein [Maliibacterium massiliense]
MKLKKCPRCELNYIPEDEELCPVCRKATFRGKDHDEEADGLEGICIECGENPVVPGEDYCAACLRAHSRVDVGEVVETDPEDDVDDEDLDASPVSQIEEIDIDVPSDIPPEELSTIAQELADDDEDDAFDDEEQEDTQA